MYFCSVCCTDCSNVVFSLFVADFIIHGFCKHVAVFLLPEEYFALVQLPEAHFIVFHRLWEDSW